MNLIFSHESDIDGAGAVVLAKLAFGEIDYRLYSNVESLEEAFRLELENGTLNAYDFVYITDLSLLEPTLSLLASSDVASKCLIFDHHERAISEGLDKYDFSNIVVADSKGKRSGTDLFYEYLRANNLIKNSAAIELFVELTRLEDTWEWKKDLKSGNAAHDLAILFNVIGVRNYIDTMVSRLAYADFYFTEEEKALIQNKKDEYERKLKDLLAESEYFNDEDNNKFGMLFADYEYRNELAEYVKNSGNKEDISYLIIAALNKGLYGQKSYRSIKPEMDVNDMASRHGGGGHKEAASVNITQEQREHILTLNKRDALEYLSQANYK